MQNTIRQNAAMDLDSVRQFLGLADRTLQRARLTLATECTTAKAEERKELNHLADQCHAEQKLLDRAIDGMGGLNTDVLETTTATQMFGNGEEREVCCG